MEIKIVNEEQLVVSNETVVRNGWAVAFAKYALEGEDEMLLPDIIDNELD